MSPFSDLENQQVQSIGERKLIDKIKQWIAKVSPPAPHGMGDDAAIIRLPDINQVITKDALVYGKHFDDSASGQQVGEKLLKRNLSDLAAMGAEPDHAVIACLIPPPTSISWLEDFYQGLKACATEYRVDIIGGDITSTFRDLAFTLTLIGKGPKTCLTRKTAKAGDSLWVTGSLGGSILGRHLTFTPRLREGSWLAQHQEVSSGMDLSDGLATDLQHLCPDACLLELDTDAVPTSSAALKLANKTGKPSIYHALTDGEDYELLFTLSPKLSPSDFTQQWSQQFDTQVTCIGKVLTSASREDHSIQYRGSFSQTDLQGYEHFR